VLAEIRFSPVLKMDAKLPEIQEDLRTHGFPSFRRDTTHQIELSGDQPPKVTTGARWVFGAKDQRTFVVLSQESMAFEVTSYDSFESFMDILGPVLEVVGKQVEPVLSERVGLRYVNSINPQEGHDLSRYLRPSMMGLGPEELGAESLLWRVETAGTVPVGEIKVRLSQNLGGPLLPPDLLAPELVQIEWSDGSTLRTTLDIDCSYETTADFDGLEILDRLWLLHDYTNRAFWASVTEEALTAWGGSNEVK
jgi:uncharacterized protein (TIGR04255 family)